MAKEILLKRSSVEGKEPAVSGMSYGELFINYAFGEGKSFLTTKKADDTIAKFMEKSYNDAHYANKDVVDNIEEKTQENTDAIYGLTDEIIKTERVIANTLNTINQSAGFDENGNSTLGKSLTDAIKELQDSNGGSTETLDNLQNQIDGIKDEISDLTDDIDAVDGKINTLEENVDTKISGLTDNITTVENDIKNLQNKDIEISNVISGIQETVTDIQDGIDGLQTELDDAVKDLNDYINTKVSSAYIFKGSVNTFNDLPKEGLTNGDVYNVAENYNNHPAGTNWAWVAPKTNENGDILEEGYWDALAGIVDLSGYATTGTTASLQDQIDEISNDYVKNDDLTTAIDGVNSKFDNYATTATTSELSNKVAENTSAITEINKSIEDIINDVDAISKDYITTDKLAGEIEKIDDKFSGFTTTGRTEEIAAVVSANTNSITGLTETVNSIGDTVDNIESDYVKHEDLDKAISGVTDEFKNYSKTGRTEEIAVVVSANTEAISNINENINDFQNEIDAVDKKISGNTVAISGLTEEIIKTERVIAHTINTINQSAGFNENGESTLDDGESLTDAIKNLQTKNGEIEGNLSNLQNTVDTISSDYVTTTELNDVVKIVDDKLSGFTPNEKVNEILILVSANTDSISAINETINTIETNLDNLSEKVEDNITDISGLTEDINDMKLKFDEYTTTARTEEIAVAVSANTDSILAISGVVENIQTVVDDISENYITENDLDNAIDEIDNKFKLYTTVTRTEEISQVVSANTDSISAISGTVKTIQDNYDNLSEKVEDNITDISGLIDEIIKTERVIANTLNTINQSAGFNENGESTLDSGMTLTDAIKALQAKDIEIEGAVSDVQDKVDEMDSEIQTAISSLTETINTKISSAYIFKGSVDKFENLPSGLTSENIGYVYNVEEKYNNIPAGTNYAWDGEKWDALAGIVDLSIYTTSAVTNEMQTKIDAIESNLSTNYATSASVVSAITEINENFNNYATTSVTNEIAIIASNNSESIQNISGVVTNLSSEIDNIDYEITGVKESVSALTQEVINNEEVTAQAINTIVDTIGLGDDFSNPLGTTIVGAIKDLQDSNGGSPDTINGILEDIDNLDSEVEGVKESVSALTQEVIDNEEVVANALATIKQSTGLDENGYSTLGMSLSDAIEEKANSEWVSENFLSTTGGTVNGSLSLSEYLHINSWAGYGSGSASFWYDGNNNTLNITADTIRLNDNPVLHSGNYSDYSLPITGGTVNGNLRVDGISSFYAKSGGGTYFDGDSEGGGRVVMVMDPANPLGSGMDYLIMEKYLSGHANISNANGVLALQTNQFNVAIGGTTADEKLHVHGNVKANNFIGDLNGTAAKVNVVNETGEGEYALAILDSYSTNSQIIKTSGSGDNRAYFNPANGTLKSHLIKSDAVGKDMFIAYPNGGQFDKSDGNATGAIKIKLPVSWSSTMIMFHVDIYNYVDQSSATYVVGGYNYYDGRWYSTFAYGLGHSYLSDLNVRFGHDGETCCIYIGETTTQWLYPKISIYNVTVGQNLRSFEAFDDYWAISIVNSMDNITSTISKPNPIGRYLPLSGGECSGNIYAPDFCTTSDARLKDFVGDVEVDFNKLKTIPKKYYYWKDKASGEDLQIGTSAQDLKEVYPTCVQYDEKLDKYSVNYQKLSVVALAAIDKLHEENEELRSELNKQKEELESQKELIKKQQEQIDKILKSLNQ